MISIELRTLNFELKEKSFLRWNSLTVWSWEQGPPVTSIFRCMKVTVIGAGAIGSAIARDLVERDNVSHVQVCDSHARLLQQLDNQLKSPKLRSFQVDVRDLRVLSSILNSSDVAIGAVVSRLNPRLARLCLDQKIHFCDLGGDDSTVHEILSMNEEAKRKSIWLVPNCGLAPGLVNILSRTAVAEFDEVDTVRLRVGGRSLESGAAL